MDTRIKENLRYLFTVDVAPGGEDVEKNVYLLENIFENGSMLDL